MSQMPIGSLPNGSSRHVRLTFQQVMKLANQLLTRSWGPGQPMLAGPAALPIRQEACRAHPHHCEQQTFLPE